MRSDTRNWLDSLRAFAIDQRHTKPPVTAASPAEQAAERMILAAQLSTWLAGVEDIVAARRAWLDEADPEGDGDPAIVVTTSPVGIGVAEHLARAGSLPARSLGQSLVAVTELEYRLWCMREPDTHGRLHVTVWNWIKSHVPPQRHAEFSRHPLAAGEAYWRCSRRSSPNGAWWSCGDQPRADSPLRLRSFPVSGSVSRECRLSRSLRYAMPPRILLTTTSFQDTPGEHHARLAATGWEVVTARGPLSEADTLALVGDVDGYICGDDVITRRVLEKARPRLGVLSKYGIGVDKIDLAACTELGIPVLFTPGVNHTTVAEHAFLLLLAIEKNLLFHCDSTRSGGWKRQTGHELCGKTIGIVGLGRIGREVATRARAFGMKPLGYDVFWDEAFATEHGVARAKTLDELFAASDFISLHTNLTPETRDLVRSESIAKMKPDVIVINCARGEIVNTADMAAALRSGRVRGYGTDVLDVEPPPADHPLTHLPNCLVTPHVGSRTCESVERQAVAAVENLVRAMHGEQPLAQVNPEVPVKKVVAGA